MKRCILFCFLFLAVAGPVLSENVNPLSLGISDYRDESFEEAIDALKEARAAQPASFEAALYLGLSYKAIQDFAEARAHLSDAARLRPGSLEARLSLAEVLFHLGEYEAADREIEIVKSKGFRPGDALFLKGLLHMKTGRTDEAISSFRAAKAADSSLSQAADYQTGLAYMNDGRYDEALESFDEVVVKDPATDLAQYAREYARSIEKKKERERPLKLSAGFRFEYDDNVLLKPADATAARGITGEADFREVVTFRADHTKKTKGPWSLRSYYSLYATNQHQLESHEVISNSLGITPSYNYANGSAFLAVTYGNSIVESALYLDSFTLQPSWSHMLNSSNMLTVSARLQKREYHREPFLPAEDRDSIDHGLSAAYYGFFSNGGFINLRYELNREDADGVNWDYLGNRASVNLLYPAGEKFKFQAFAEMFIQDFANENTFFSVKREDKVFTGSVLASYAVTGNADLMVQYTHVKDYSNIDIYYYERNIYSAGIDYRF